MKKILVILVLMVAFTATSFSAPGFVPANKKYTTAKYKKKMRKRSSKAIYKMCKKKYFINHAYQVKCRKR